MIATYKEVLTAGNLSVYFPDEKDGLRKGLPKLAKKHDRSASYVVLKAIEAYLETEQEE